MKILDFCRFNNFLIVFYSSLLFGQESAIKIDESFDPSTLNEPPIELPLIINPNDSIPAFDELVEPDSVIMGYRVQVLSTTDYAVADSVSQKLDEKYNNEVYVEFLAPNYKVRIGNFISRYGAEEHQKYLRKAGYKTAWIIRTPIKTNIHHR